MGARLKVQAPGVRQGEKVRIDVGRDRDGEFFDVRCQDGIVPEILEASFAPSCVDGSGRRRQE